MSFNTSSLGITEKGLIKGFEKEILATLQICRDMVASNKANTELNRWFGDSGKDFTRDVKEKVAKMRSHLLNTNIKCEMGKGLAVDNNAQANHFTVGLTGVNSLLAVDHAATKSDTFSKVMIGPNFKSLSKYATNPLAVFADQDQFETLVHELSHVVLGTKDEVNAGVTAYGGTNARNLAASANAAVKAKARTNAENWGFFVEEFRKG